MSRIQKVIEKIELNKSNAINREIGRVQARYDEAWGNHHDTGYDRYYKVMLRCEEELKELYDYKNRESAIDDALATRKACTVELKEIKKTLKTKMFYLQESLPDCSELRNLREYIESL